MQRNSQIGDLVIDPFAGRGTAVFSAAALGRPAIGIDINPLGFVYGKTKIQPGDHQQVLERLRQVQALANQYFRESQQLPPFFHVAYHSRVRQFLLAAKHKLDWRQHPTDRTLMAIILVSLHGKSGAALSNQMRQTTAMAPDYCIRWWQERGLHPPDLCPVDFLTKRINWRYAKGKPQLARSSFHLGDSAITLPEIVSAVPSKQQPKATLLLTSPPYHNVTNYYYDQWIRLWLLGGPPEPNGLSETYGGKFSNLANYRALLQSVFSAARPLMTDDAVIYVRTGNQPTTLEATTTALRSAFPDKAIEQTLRPTQAGREHRPYSRGGAPRSPNCEVDVILTPRRLPSNRLRQAHAPTAPHKSRIGGQK